MEKCNRTTAIFTDALPVLQALKHSCKEQKKAKWRSDRVENADRRTTPVDACTLTVGYTEMRHRVVLQG